MKLGKYMNLGPGVMVGYVGPHSHVLHGHDQLRQAPGAVGDQLCGHESERKVYRTKVVAKPHTYLGG